MENYYQTRDLYETAALMLKENILSLEEEDGHYVFIFSQKAKKTAEDYWAGKLTGSILSYSQNIRSLKDRIFAQKRCK